MPFSSMQAAGTGFADGKEKLATEEDLPLDAGDIRTGELFPQEISSD
jgi:hypothetical protein